MKRNKGKAVKCGKAERENENSDNGKIYTDKET